MDNKFEVCEFYFNNLGDGKRIENYLNSMVGKGFKLISFSKTEKRPEDGGGILFISVFEKKF